MDNLVIKTQEIKKIILNGDNSNNYFVQLLNDYINDFHLTDNKSKYYSNEIYTDDDIDCMIFDIRKQIPIQKISNKPGGIMQLIHYGIQDNILLCEK